MSDKAAVTVETDKTSTRQFWGFTYLFAAVATTKIRILVGKDPKTRSPWLWSYSANLAAAGPPNVTCVFLAS